MKHLEKNPWVRVQKTREQQPFGVSQVYCPELYKAIRSCRAGRTGWLWEASALGVADHEHRHSTEADMVAGFNGRQGD